MNRYNQNENSWMHDGRYAAAILFALVTVSYFTSLFNPFMWDDRVLVLYNPGIQQGWGGVLNAFSPSLWGGRLDNDAFRSFYRPMHTILSIFDYEVWGLNPFGFHLSNTVLHLANTLMLYFFAVKVVKDRAASLLAASLFAVHPVHTESVTFISARVDLLATFFMLPSFYLYISSVNSGRLLNWRYVLSLVLFLFALFSKEMALTMPALVAAYALFFEERGGRAIRVTPYFIVLALYILFRVFGLEVFVQQHQLRADVVTLAATASAAVFDYIRLLVFPYPLKAFYSLEWHSPASPKAIAGFILLAASFACFIRFVGKGKKTAAFTLLWTFLTLAPVLNIGALGEFSLAERYLYIPSIGFSMLAGISAVKLFRYRFGKMVPYASVFVLVVLIALTIQRNRVWGDDITFYKSMAEGASGSAIPHANLAHAYYRADKLDLAIEEMGRASALAPGNDALMLELGSYYLKAKRYGEAASVLEKAVELNPGAPQEAFNYLGVAYAESGRLDLAEAAFERALSINPGSSSAASNLQKIRDERK